MKNYPYYRHTPIHTIKELLQRCAGDYGGRTAFAYQEKKQEITVSYSCFADDVDALGSWLYKNGYKDSRIAIFGENSYEWILSYFAAACGRIIVVPIDRELDADGAFALLQDSGSRVLFYSAAYSDIVEQIRRKADRDIRFIHMGDIPAMVSDGKQNIKSGYTEYADCEIARDDLASIVYTSGTTGKSKGVMLTHYNLMSDLYGAACNVLITGDSLLLLPLHHTFGLVAGVFGVLYHGFTIYINRSLKKLKEDLRTARPQNLFVVPLMVEMLYKTIWSTAEKQGRDRLLRKMIRVSDGLLKIRIDLRKVLFKSVADAFGGNLELIVSGGAPLDQKYISAFASFGITLLNGYGITECGPIVAVNRNRFNIAGSVGMPLNCNTVKMSDEGEILVRGDNVTQGYYNNPDENGKAFCGGWFRTGDIGYLDSSGALHVTGRIKNLIILGNGENIPAEAIEEYIYTIPYVKEAVAYGENNMIVAEVYLDEDAADAKERIEADIRAVNRTMPLNRNIGRVVIRNTEFPKTTTRKIKRNYGGNNNA